jgi:hypothetical protein
VLSQKNLRTHSRINTQISRYRGIIQSALVAAVHALSWATSGRTRSSKAGRLRTDDHVVSLALDSLHLDTAQMQQHDGRRGTRSKITLPK